MAVVVVVVVVVVVGYLYTMQLALLNLVLFRKEDDEDQ